VRVGDGIRKQGFETSKAVAVSSGEVERIAKAFLPSEKLMRNATNAAIKKTLRWAMTLAVREIRYVTGLPAGVLRQRIQTFWRRGSGRLFLGLRPVPLWQLDPRQTNAGVTAKGGVKISGAFIADMLDHPAVFKRVGKANYPIEYQRVFFDDVARNVIEGDILPKIEGKFYNLLEHELKWRTR